MKELLAFSAYYEPEVAASLYLSINLYEGFAANGWKVNLFVPVPTRGVDDITRNYYKKHKIEKKGNLAIQRVPLMKEGKNTLGRVIRYILMNLIFIWKGLITKGDAIFVQSTPPTQGAMAAIIKKIKKVPFIYNLQDVFPDSMVGMGMITEESLIYRIGRTLENFTYKNADQIVVISNDIKKNIIRKGVPENKISVVSNWIDTDIIKPVEKENNYLFEKFGISKTNFNIVYAGNLGYAQNIEIIIRAAKQLESYHDINFVIFGRGAQEEEYRKRAYELKLSNLSFFPIQPYSEVAFVYSIGDAAIVSCKKGFGGSAMPSKTWSIMACGIPILASFDRNTDMEKLINEQHLGLFSEADKEGQLTSNILYLYKNKDICNQYGLNCRQYAIKNVSRNHCLEKYTSLLTDYLG